MTLKPFLQISSQIKMLALDISKDKEMHKNVWTTTITLHVWDLKLLLL